MKRTSVVGGLLLLLISACGSPVGELEGERHLSQVSTEPGVIYPIAMPDVLKGDTPAQRAARARSMDATMEVYEDVRKILKSDRSMSEKSRAARALLDNQRAAPEARWLLEQVVALHMMAAYDPESRNTADVEDVGLYTRLLVKHKNPSADLILKGLHAVRGSWTEDEVAVAARTAITQAEAWLDRVCVGCKTGVEAADVPIQEARSMRSVTVSKAVAELAGLIE